MCSLRLQAEELLESFPYGDEFFKINKTVLDAYSQCETGAEVIFLTLLELLQLDVSLKKNYR